MTLDSPRIMGRDDPMTSRNGRRNPNVSPKMAREHENKKTTMKDAKKIAGPGRTGDVISDEDSQLGDSDQDGGTAGHDEHEDDGDEPDAVALSDDMSPGDSVASHLTGRSDDYEGARYDTFDGANDDDYAGVADISESEESIADDEENEDSLLRMAEEDLIQEFKRHERPRTPAAEVSRTDQTNMDEFDLDPGMWDLDPFQGLSSTDYRYVSMIESAEVAFDNELARWRMPEAPRARENSVQSMSQKKVRFESTSSRASSESSDDDIRADFPDLFADMDDSSLRHRSTLTAAIPYADTNYEFDLDDEYDTATVEGEGDGDGDGDLDDDGDGELDHEMSGTESDDDGDTTDEETVDEQMARLHKMQIEKGESIDNISTRDADKRAGRKSASLSRRTSTSGVFETPRNARKPKTGTFINDPTSASVSADIKGSGVKLVCPTRPPERDRAYWERARASMRGEDGSPRGSWTRATPRAPSIPTRPLTAKSTLGTLFDGNLDFMRNHDVAGIAGDLLMQSGNRGLQPSFTSTTSTEDDATDIERNVNMADFVRLEDSESDTDVPMSVDAMSPQRDDLYSDISLVSSPIRRRDSTAPGFLDHLEQQRGLVSSFRNNQHHARHWSSLPSDPTKRAQASEQNALQVGRRAAANVAMTPARKKRGSQDMRLTGSGVKKANASPMMARRRQSRGNSLSGIHQTLSLDRFASDGSKP